MFRSKKKLVTYIYGKDIQTPKNTYTKLLEFTTLTCWIMLKMFNNLKNYIVKPNTAIAKPTVCTYLCKCMAEIAKHFHLISALYFPGVGWTI